MSAPPDEPSSTQEFEALLAVHLIPLIDTDSTPLGISITSHDVTHQQRLQVELGKSRQDLETAYEELESTNDELRGRINEVDQSKAFPESILASLHAAAVVVDPNCNILMWA